MRPIYPKSVMKSMSWESSLWEITTSRKYIKEFYWIFVDTVVHPRGLLYEYYETNNRQIS